MARAPTAKLVIEVSKNRFAVAVRHAAGCQRSRDGVAER